MTQFLTLYVTFQTEAEDSPHLDDLLAEVESRLHRLEGVYGVNADVATATQCFTILAEIEGDDVSWSEANDELSLAVKEMVKLAAEPVVGDPIEEEV